VGLIRNDQSIQLLVRLHSKQLILLSLCEMQQFFNLLLLAHLSLLLLLFEVVFLHAVPLEVRLFVLVTSQPSCELVVLSAVMALINCYHEDRRGE